MNPSRSVQTAATVAALDRENVTRHTCGIQVDVNRFHAAAVAIDLTIAGDLHFNRTRRFSGRKSSSALSLSLLPFLLIALLPLAGPFPGYLLFLLPFHFFFQLRFQKTISNR